MFTESKYNFLVGFLFSFFYLLGNNILFTSTTIFTRMIFILLFQLSVVPLQNILITLIMYCSSVVCKWRALLNLIKRHVSEFFSSISLLCDSSVINVLKSWLSPQSAFLTTPPPTYLISHRSYTTLSHCRWKRLKCGSNLIIFVSWRYLQLRARAHTRAPTSEGWLGVPSCCR